ncbi:bifunctional lysine-specific demethylase and histidyl-hydroxylase NO66 [Eupeodes corollae]|uniref:bifunctional lysine-specific demethylase and histidyl-hydroxylase NO66 n=1 Tax=Eupeodes corollae TaxID=290404 RepID=UPI0024914F69|nr:bifunctional lysine-specific demethylase and histidyl-hydroxylase NO66 [Eupeodes corollae]
MEAVSAFAVYKKTGLNTSSKNRTDKKQKKNKKKPLGTPNKSGSPSTHQQNGKYNKSNSGNEANIPKIPKKRKQNNKQEESAKVKKSTEPNGIKDEVNSVVDDKVKEQIPKKKKKQAGGETAEKTPKSKDTATEANKSLGSIKKELPSPSINLPLRNNSIKDGTKLFKWLISPIGADMFFDKFWEKAPCLIERNNPSYFSKLISFEMIDQMLINNHIEFTKNIDITSYKNGIRETLNPEGRAIPPVVWDHYSNGCSIRLLNPQTYLDGIFAMNSSLQEMFHCMVGSNAYLTPPNSQGFAPHYDDIEAFVLQIEGRKRWKLYNPRNKKEELPRFSSENFSQNQIGKPILEKVLMPGDILYFPRGTIHQAFTEPGFHSLHITLSVYQKQSYADLFEKLFPMILQRAIAEDVDMRRGLPLNVWHNAGIVYSEEPTRERKDFLRKCRDLISKSLQEMPIDQAVDQLAKKFQHEALPPNISDAERSLTVFGCKNKVDSKGNWVSGYNINSMTKVRLLRANIMRLVEEEDSIRIYYYVDNSKEYCEYEPNYIEIESECATSVDVLIRSYPEYVAVNELPLEDDEKKKIGIVTALWERGLLMFEKPFNK